MSTPSVNTKPRGRFAWLRPPQFDENGAMSIWDHLREIRYRLVVSALAVLVLFIVAFIWYVPLVELILRPYQIAAQTVQAQDRKSTRLNSSHLR